jgi:hypothetical protein
MAKTKTIHLLAALLISSNTIYAQLPLHKAIVLGIPVADGLAITASGTNSAAYYALHKSEKERYESLEALEKELRESLKYYDATMELFRLSVNENLSVLEDQHRRLADENERTVLLNFGRSKYRQRLRLCRSLLDNIKRSNNVGISDLVVINGERVQAIFDLEKQLLQVKKMLDDIDGNMARLRRTLSRL